MRIVTTGKLDGLERERDDDGYIFLRSPAHTSQLVGREGCGHAVTQSADDVGRQHKDRESSVFEDASGQRVLWRKLDERFRVTFAATRRLLQIRRRDHLGLREARRRRPYRWRIGRSGRGGRKLQSLAINRVAPSRLRRRTC